MKIWPDTASSKFSVENVDPSILATIIKKGPLLLRQAQRPPCHDDWSTWLLIGGRGSGKTRTGSEWVHGLATGTRPFAKTVTGPLALIGETIGDVREVMIDGPAGIRSCALYDKPSYEASRRRLVWPNGSIAYVFSAHDPESLRGPQFAAAWCDAKTIWATLVSVSATAATFFGYNVDMATQAGVTEGLLQVVSAVSGLFAIFGRLSASQRIA